ncbi:MAG: hypothetical protein IH851_08535 [Armatimonadetes bacterium]|nr:hypothetical protein [Armatimonadota bacterium]
MTARAQRAEVTIEGVIRGLADLAENAPSCMARSRALELLGKHLGMFRGKGQQEPKIMVVLDC